MCPIPPPNKGFSPTIASIKLYWTLGTLLGGSSDVLLDVGKMPRIMGAYHSKTEKQCSPTKITT
jgi:hypothetical protein